MGFVWGFLRLLVGLVFGALAALALAPAIAALMSEANDSAGYVAFAVVALVALACLFAPSMRRAFGRGFLMLGACVLALPLSTLLLSGRAASEVSAASGNEAAAIVGAGLAATMMTGAAAFIGFFLGAILLIIGLVLALGGRREVVVVERFR